MPAMIPVLLTALTAAAPGLPDEAALRAQHARFAAVELTADVTALPPAEREALAHILEAAKVMDALFLRQVWAGNESLLWELQGDTTPLGRARLDYFRLNKGPWSRLDQDQPFLPGVPPKPPAANFYPAGAEKSEVESWMASLTGPERDAATGYFTTIRRDPAGRLIAVPYSLEYQGELAQAASHLRAAAARTTNASLKTFLEKRAASFISNDYYDSDVAWMEMDAPIDVTIGPYETYEDGWFNYKAAFEAFVGLRDDAYSAQLQRFSSHLQELENNLPIEPRLRNPKLGALAPIRVVNLLFSSGDANRGVQTIAFNLPNDERVVTAKGSKRVMLKNSNEAKFKNILLPIAARALAPADRERVSFDAFFTHVLMHELMHGLGPQAIEVGGRKTTVRQEMKELNAALEEAKADISGLWALQYLADRGVVDAKLQQSMYATFLASTFRSIRFGLKSAHGKGIAIQLNSLLDAGAFVVNPDGTFSVKGDRVRKAVADLAGKILTLQAHGDYAGAKELQGRLGVVRPEVQRVLDRLGDIPVDIEPSFQVR